MQPTAMNIEQWRGTRALQSRFPSCECWPWQTANLWLSRGQNFSPASLPGFFSFIKSQPPHARHSPSCDLPCLRFHRVLDLYPISNGRPAVFARYDGLTRTYLKIVWRGRGGRRAARSQGSSSDKTPSGQECDAAIVSRRRSVQPTSAWHIAEAVVHLAWRTWRLDRCGATISIPSLRNSSSSGSLS